MGEVDQGRGTVARRGGLSSSEIRRVMRAVNAVGYFTDAPSEWGKRTNLVRVLRRPRV